MKSLHKNGSYNSTKQNKAPPGEDKKVSPSSSRAVNLDDVTDVFSTNGAEPTLVLFDGCGAVEAHAHVPASVQHTVDRSLTTHRALVTRFIKRTAPNTPHGR